MPAPAHAARLSTFSALKGRNYSLYWFGLVFYVLGHRAEYTTFAWITWEVTRNPMSLAYLGLAQGVVPLLGAGVLVDGGHAVLALLAAAPLVLFQLFGGVLADRINRLRLLVTTQTLISLNLATAFVLTALGIARLEHLLVLAALFALLFVLGARALRVDQATRGLGMERPSERARARRPVAGLPGAPTA